METITNAKSCSVYDSQGVKSKNGGKSEPGVRTIIIEIVQTEFYIEIVSGIQHARQRRGIPGIEPGTSRTLSENHAARPNPQLVPCRNGKC